ncbi:MAG: hypothetical protein JWM21_75 [Acidobacteria bacterium]|nr:hypothetical protein [Acidobacteriota bacterium]
MVVEPRDTRQLNEACADLETQVINARGFSEALDPALALSYVNDSVAIPYLEGLISSRQLVDGYAITGLERIGTDDAIEALRLAAKSENKNTAVLANQALARLARKMSEKPGRTK